MFRAERLGEFYVWVKYKLKLRRIVVNMSVAQKMNEREKLGYFGSSRCLGKGLKIEVQYYPNFPQISTIWLDCPGLIDLLSDQIWKEDLERRNRRFGRNEDSGNLGDLVKLTFKFYTFFNPFLASSLSWMHFQSCLHHTALVTVSI